MCTPGAKNLVGNLRILLSPGKQNEPPKSVHIVNYTEVIKGEKGLGELLLSDFQDMLYAVV